MHDKDLLCLQRVRGVWSVASLSFSSILSFLFFYTERQTALHDHNMADRDVNPQLMQRTSMLKA